MPEEHPEHAKSGGWLLVLGAIGVSCMRISTLVCTLGVILAGNSLALAQGSLLQGDYTLNVPQVPGMAGPPVWTFDEGGGTLLGTTTFNVSLQPSLNVTVNGTLGGTSLFSLIYFGTATYDSTPNLYDSLQTYVLFVKLGNNLNGLALDTLMGLPISAPYPVEGAPYTPPAAAKKARRR